MELDTEAVACNCILPVSATSACNDGQRFFAGKCNLVKAKLCALLPRCEQSFRYGKNPNEESGWQAVQRA
jgi:hypothetical protein